MNIGQIVKTPSKLIGLVIDKHEACVVAFSITKAKLYPENKLTKLKWDDITESTQQDLLTLSKYCHVNLIKNGSK